MENTLIKLEVHLDPTNPEHIEAVSRFMRSIGGLEDRVPTCTVLRNQATTKETTTKETTAQAKKRKALELKATKAKEAALAEIAKIKADLAEKEAAAKGEVSSTYSEEEVRALTTEKAATHRVEVKAKLTQLGANNVSSLAVEDYIEYMEYLKVL